ILVLALSFNQPKFCSEAIWNPNGITFADQSVVGQDPTVIFVSINNTIYAANRENKTILIWHEESLNPTKIIYDNFTKISSLFVTSNGDIYIGDSYGIENGRVQKWSAKTNNFVTVMNAASSCDVVKRLLSDSLMTSNRVAAGTGVTGHGLNQFHGPYGIFVDVNLDLYVADCENDRVQLFQSGKSNGITVAGRKSLNPTITLNCPYGIILDTDKYLFIVEKNNDRIVGSGLNGFRCLVGCYGWGSQSNQLRYPFSFSFDHSGNMFVTDSRNGRIQKFQYLEESCMNTSTVVQTVYASEFTTNSSTYFLSSLSSSSYYEAIQVNVRRSGLYTFVSKSNMDTIGFIYNDYFNPSHPNENRLVYNDDSCGAAQFRFTIVLETSITYILVVTIYDSKVTGAFSIFVSGPNHVDLENITTTTTVAANAYNTTTTTTTTTLTTTTTTSTTTTTTEIAATTTKSSAVTTWFSSKFGQFILFVPTALIYSIYIHN
ncbi:unnamed protein product, partial [Adineta steineri]